MTYRTLLTAVVVESFKFQKVTAITSDTRYHTLSDVALVADPCRAGIPQRLGFAQAVGVVPASPGSASEIQARSPDSVQATWTFIPVVLCLPE